MYQPVFILLFFWLLIYFNIVPGFTLNLFTSVPLIASLFQMFDRVVRHSHICTKGKVFNNFKTGSTNTVVCEEVDDFYLLDR